MKLLATLLLVLQLGPLAGPVLCHVQPSCGMPQHATAMTMPGGMDPRDCSTIQVCSPAVLAVVSSATRLEPTLPQGEVTLTSPRSLAAGVRAAPLPPPPRA